MTIERLILKRAADSRSSGDWNDDDYDVLADGVVVGRIMKAAAKPGADVVSINCAPSREPTHQKDEKSNMQVQHELDDFLQALPVSQRRKFTDCSDRQKA